MHAPIYYMTSNDESVLRVSHLKVKLGGNVIIRDLSFELENQETLVILGPNGAGKTILLRTLLGLVPFRGAISWKTGLKIGYVPQRIPLNKDLPITVEDFFELKNVFKEKAIEALQQVGITDEAFLNRQLGFISSGQIQRVLIAWALLKDPDVLLFDEPTAGVDIEGEEKIHNLIERTQRNRKLSVILVTHDLTTVYAEATHVLCMNNKTYCYGVPKEILDPQILQMIYGREIRYFRHRHE